MVFHFNLNLSDSVIDVRDWWLRVPTLNILMQIPDTESRLWQSKIRADTISKNRFIFMFTLTLFLHQPQSTKQCTALPGQRQHFLIPDFHLSQISRGVSKGSITWLHFFEAPTWVLVFGIKAPRLGPLLNIRPSFPVNQFRIYQTAQFIVKLLGLLDNNSNNLT